MTLLFLKLKIMLNKIGIIGLRGFPANFPGSSGIDTYLEKILLHLIKNKKTEVNLYTRSWSNSKSFSKKINIINIPSINNKYLDTSIYSILAFFKAVKKNDILWFHAPSSCLLLPMAKMFGKKIIFTYHGIDWQREKWANPITKQTLKFLEYLAVKFSDVITVVSADLQNYIRKKYKIDCCLTVPGLEIKKTKKNKKLKKFSLKTNKYLLYLGRLVPEKRIDWFIKAFVLNKKINQKYKLVIAGYLENTDYCRNLFKLAKNNANIIFTDYVRGELKDELISNCKLFVSPSRLEGNSLSINEAIEYQKKCLIADIPIHKELSLCFPNIHLFKTNSFNDFKSSLFYSLNQIKKVKKILSFSTWDKTADKYKQIINQLNKK